MDYAPIPILKFPTKPIPLTAEQRYWRSFKNALLRQDKFKIVSVSASPRFYVIGSEMRFRFFNYANGQRYSISMFKSPVTASCFRADGEIFAGADTQGKVKLFQTKRKLFLKEFKHRGPVHALSFVGKTNFVTGCDDKTVRLWDVSSAKEVLTLTKAHSECVRAIGIHENMIMSGGYDGVVKLWDSRSGDAVSSMNHGEAVNGLVAMDGSLYSAGHTSIKAWDLSNYELTGHSQPHGKTITSLSADDIGTRLVSSSLDCCVKFHSPKDLTVLHTIKYPSEVTDVALTSDNNHLVVGMSDGKLSVRQKRQIDVPIETNDEGWLKFPIGEPDKVKDYKYFYRGAYLKSDMNDIKQYKAKLKRLKKYDKLLKAFQYGAALDKAMETQRPEIVVALLQELDQRNGLVAALKNRSPDQLDGILDFLLNKVTSEKYRNVIYKFLDKFMDLYSCVVNVDDRLKNQLIKLQKVLTQEIELEQGCLELEGIIDMCLN